ncbi:hypothetical protein KFE25_010197 [Diacronema lutheri]|uniref:Uncharacterized protein n=1 Tax=Diacronema lutheri TaxID=2081491 RepID=A0A8J6C9R2_DIALT|nr:hypothetical protein KFE25_010197 [Diacronema lutheri]
MADVAIADDLARLLASMDVDGLRLALHARHGAAEGAAVAECALGAAPGAVVAERAPAPDAPPPELSALRRRFPIRFRLSARGGGDGSVRVCRDFMLVNERVIGKVCWPAAEALAAHLLAIRLAENAPSAARPVLLELGAGCALPSLAAASTGAFARVIATEMTEERVAIAAHNAELNGLELESSELLFADAERMRALVGSAPSSIVLCAADVHYNPEALVELIASAAALMRDRQDAADAPPRADKLLLARSAVFTHNDELMLRTAAEHGLALVGAESARCGGVLHAASPTLFEPNPNDSADLFRFIAHRVAPARAAPLASDAAREPAPHADAHGPARPAGPVWAESARSVISN